MSGLPPDLQSKLDLPPASLNALEAWLLQQYPQPLIDVNERFKLRTYELAHMAWPEQDPQQYLNLSALYVGEVLRKDFVGTKWSVFLHDSREDMFDVPIIVMPDEPYLDMLDVPTVEPTRDAPLKGPLKFWMCPLGWVFTCIERQTGTSLYGFYAANRANKYARVLEA